jgi:hypothetical protein
MKPVDKPMMCPRAFAKARDAALVRNALLARLLFGHADGGDFRHGVDAVREEFRRRMRDGAERVARGDAALLHRRGGERRKADHVADRVDVRRGGLERLWIDLDPPARIGLQAAELQRQGRGRALSAGGEQHHVGVNLPAILDMHDAGFGAELFDLHGAAFEP